MTEDQQRRGIAELTSRLAKSGLNLIEQDRPWPNRRVTYFEVGRGDRQTSIVLSDEFVCDLPATKEYQDAIDPYATALSGRIRCGSPNLFYCRSHVAIDVSISWPMQSGFAGNELSSWLLADASNELRGSLAKCCVNIEHRSVYSGRTMFDDVRYAVNRIRIAVDDGSVTFFNQQSHPASYQRAGNDLGQPSEARSRAELETFIAGKTYMLSFQLPDVPGETYVVDPWDAEYLGVSRKDLSQAAQVLRARGLIDLDSTLNFARPADKLLTLGWPAAIDSSVPGPTAQVFEISRLPKKQELLTELRKCLAEGLEVAVMVIDLDQFKQVNDTKGHAEGDACLEDVVKTVGNALGRKGTLYRWGGDEFAITLRNFSTEEAAVTAERIRRAIENGKPGKDIAVTASVGLCATDRLQNSNAETMLDAADKAMYVSKKTGKNRVTIWPFE
jgi:diguanylate cyclase (GGDEF)-like protein